MITTNAGCTNAYYTVQYDRTYASHVGLVIALFQDGETYRVTITGDRKKTLFSGEDKTLAEQVYKDTVAMYEERKKQESGNSNSL